MKTERKTLVVRIEQLTDCQQQLMAMFYEHHMSLAEIAAVLKTTEADVCATHREILERLGHDT